MVEQANLPETSDRDSILFRSEEPSGADAFRLTLYLGFAAFSLSFMLSGRVNTVFGFAAWGLVLAFSAFFIADGTYNAVRMIGKTLGGFLVDQAGILDRTSWGSFGRVYWEEIKVFHPGRSSFLGIPKAHRLIGLDVTDSYLERRPPWMRFKIWLNRRVFRVPDLQLSTRSLRDSPERIVMELKKRLWEYELGSISDGKKLGPEE